MICGHSLITKGKLTKIIWFTLLIVGMIFGQTACTKTAEKPAISEPDNPKIEDKYEGKIKEARDYLILKGLEPAEVVTKAIDGDQKVITWEDLCNNEQAMILNTFLDKKIQDISSRNNYGSVNLRSVTFLINGGNAAAKMASEIFFYDDKIIGGVTYPKDDISQEKKQYCSLAGETLAKIRHIDYRVWQAGQNSSTVPAIYYLEGKQALNDGFEKAAQIQSLGLGRLLITYQNAQESRVYFYNTKDGSDYYTGISFADYPGMRVKQLEGNKTAVFLAQKMLIVNAQDFKILEEVKYPRGEEVGIDDLDISPDGQIIAYRNKKGLVACDNHFGNARVIVEAKVGKDPNGLDSEGPRYPVFSPDSSRIMYRLVGYEWLVGTGIIAPDGSGHHYFKADSEETHYIRWYDNHQIFSSGPAYGDFQNPVLLNIETGEKTFLIPEAPKEKAIQYFLGKNNQLFYQETKINENGDLELVQFGSYDRKNKKWNTLMEGPKFYPLDFHNAAYDTENNTFGFIVSNHPLWSRPAILVGLE